VKGKSSVGEWPRGTNIIFYLVKPSTSSYHPQFFKTEKQTLIHVHKEQCTEPLYCTWVVTAKQKEVLIYLLYNVWVKTSYPMCC